MNGRTVPGWTIVNSTEHFGIVLPEISERQQDKGIKTAVHQWQNDLVSNHETNYS